MKKRENLWYNRAGALAILIAGVLTVFVDNQLEGLFICACVSLALCISRKNLFV